MLNYLKKKFIINKAIIRDYRESRGGHHMASIFDVASYILKKSGKMSTWKLQKLCYYAQAWALAWTEKPLFEENFEAWANGPVCPELFHAHAGKYSITLDNLNQGNPECLTEDEKDTIDVILRDYGDMEPYYLREMTHGETPWKNARGNLPEEASCNTVITKESMGEYYGSL